jgi:ABC-type dipeptide/oligopeptide/nickel transport system permease component
VYVLAPDQRVVTKHILRNSLLPVVTMIGLDMAVAFGGVLFVEEVFNLNALGGAHLMATDRSDIPVTTAVILFITLVVIVINFVVDVGYTWLHPRIRLE